MDYMACCKSVFLFVYMDYMHSFLLLCVVIVTYICLLILCVCLCTERRPYTCISVVVYYLN